MLDLTKKVLPSSVTVGGRQYRIKTDFRFWLRFEQLICGTALVTDFDYLYEFDDSTMKNKVPEDRQKGIDELVKFYAPSDPLPHPAGGRGERVLDCTLDADLIYAAFRMQYCIDLAGTDMHWHVFRALLHGLRETKLTDIMYYRSYTGKDKDLQALRRAWALDCELSGSEQAELDAFDALLK